VPAEYKGRIDFERVSFTYPHSQVAVLKELTLSIPSGQTVAIVGRNGAGKTTLVKLIARFYELEQGSIRIDDTDVRKLSLRWLHDHIAMVFQKPTRFEATVHDNIAFGDWQKLKDAPEEVCRLAAKTGIKGFVEKLPQGFKTHLGRLFGDETLSAGQWQLLAITRALARS